MYFSLSRIWIEEIQGSDQEELFFIFVSFWCFLSLYVLFIIFSFMRYQLFNKFRNLLLGELDILIPRPFKVNGIEKINVHKLSKISIHLKYKKPLKIHFLGPWGESILLCRLFSSELVVEELIEELLKRFPNKLEFINLE